jgi:O-antigen/teichoic acid export membrane protein
MLRKLVGYAAYMFGASSVSSLLTLGVTMLGMSTRSKEAFGDYALYVLIYTTGQSLFVLGVNAAIQKNTAGNHENRLRFAKLAYMGFLILLGVCLLIGALIWFFTERYVLLIGILGVPWVTVFFWGRYIVRSTLEARIEARMMVVGSLANSIFQFIFLTFTDWRDALIYGDVLALMTSGIVAMMLIPTGLSTPLREILRVEIPKDFWKESVRFAVPLWWAGQVFQARGVLDRSVTRLMLGPRPLGAYQAVITMWQFVAKPMEFFGQAVLPGLASSKEEERDLLYREIMRVAFLSFCFISIAVAGGITFVFQGIDFLFGLLGRESPPLQVKYAEVPFLLMVGVLSIPATAVEMVTNQYATILGKQHLVFRAQVVTVITLAAVIYPLVDWLGILGVIIANNIAAAANATTFVIGLWPERTASMRTTVRWFVACSFLTLLAMVPVYGMRGIRFEWISAFPAASIFVGGAMLFRLLGPEDFRRLARALKKRRLGPETANG